MASGGNTTQRGLGYTHQQDKRRLLAELVDGTPCPLPEWCGGEPMVHPKRCPNGPCFWCTLERDHTVPRALGGVDSAGRLSHASCNRRAGSQLGNQRRWGNRARQRQPW
jgi:hypothetical protein